MNVEDIALILNRWPQSDAPATTAVVHYTEVAAQHRVIALISLTASMPCCITPYDRMCGRGATVGCVAPYIDGTWLFLPICDRCAREIVTTYEPIPGQT
jgi:hypothetical protein